VPEGPDGLTGGKVAASRPEVVGGKKIFLVNKMADRPEGLLKIGLSPILIKDDHFSLSSLCARVRHGRTGERRKPISHRVRREHRDYIFFHCPPRRKRTAMKKQLSAAAHYGRRSRGRVQENRRLSDFSENIPPLRPWRLCGE